MTRPPIAAYWVWAALAIPSWAVVDKVLQWRGVVGYTIGAGLAMLLAPRLFAAVPQRAAGALSATTGLAVLVLFLWVYPVVNVHEAGSGSDDDDAHDVGVAAILDGESPYTRTTYLGNQLHQLPGSFLLAAPFAVVWTSALQNLFWIPMFFLAVRTESRDPRTPLVLSWLVLALSPAVLHQVVTGSSYASNAITVLLGLWWMMRAPRSPWPAIAWGLALCSRANFLFLMPLAFGWFCREFGWRLAVQRIGLTAATAAALALPFYLWSPVFGPLEAWDRMGRFDTVAPYAGVVLVVAMGALAAGLALVPADRPRLFRQGALVQAFPVIAGLILSNWLDGSTDMSFAAYGSFAAWFVLMGANESLEPWLAGTAPSPTPTASVAV